MLTLSKIDPFDPKNGAEQSDENRNALRFRLISYLVGGDPTVAEWICATLGIVWGAWLLSPTSVFATAPHLYRFVAQMPEWVWGGAFLTLGAVQWRAWYGLWQRTRFFCGLIGGTLWERYGYLIWEGDHRLPALAFLGVLAGAQLLSAIWLYGKAFPSTTDRRQGYDKG